MSHITKKESTTEDIENKYPKTQYFREEQDFNKSFEKLINLGVENIFDKYILTIIADFCVLPGCRKTPEFNIYVDEHAREFINGFYQERYGELFPENEENPEGRRMSNIKYNLVLENCTAERFKLEWLADGENGSKLIHYEDINPYETLKDQGTFAEHAWALRSCEDSKVKFVFDPNPEAFTKGEAKEAVLHILENDLKFLEIRDLSCKSSWLIEWFNE